MTPRSPVRKLRPPAPAATPRGEGPPLPTLPHGVADETLGIHRAPSAREQRARFPLALTSRGLPTGHAITPERLDVVHGWLADALRGGGPAVQEARCATFRRVVCG